MFITDLATPMNAFISFWKSYLKNMTIRFNMVITVQKLKHNLIGQRKGNHYGFLQNNLLIFQKRDIKRIQKHIITYF